MLRNLYKHTLFILLTLFILSCDRNEKKEVTETPARDTSDVYLQTITSVEDFSKKLQLIVVSDTGVIRGIDFGTPVSEVIKREESDINEPSKDAISLELDLDSTELADITYFKNNEDEVNGFRIELYLKNDKSLNALTEEFVEYFSAKYGPYKKISEGLYQWPIGQNHKMVMEAFSKGFDRGIIIDIR